MNKIYGYIAMARPPFHLVGVLPFVLGAIFIMLATYCGGEYWDYQEDHLSKEEGKSKFAGGSGVIPGGILPRKSAFYASLISLSIAVVIGFILQFPLHSGVLTLPLGTVGALGGFLYSARPVRWVKRGLGELWIAFCYGWLTVAASYYLQTSNQLTTKEGKRLLDQLAEIDDFRMVAFTGGEPLKRADFFELLTHSKSLGFENTIATNATLINDPMARKLKKCGVAIAAVSLDGVDPKTHDYVRGVPGAFEAALRGIKSLRKASILIQINITVMHCNVRQTRQLLNLADQLGSGIILAYQLVAVGRGRKISAAALDRTSNELFIRSLIDSQKRNGAVIEPVAGTQYWPLLLEDIKFRNGKLLGLAEKLFHGCSAGRGFVYIKPGGQVWPCPFVEVDCGNLRHEDFSKIWFSSTVFNKLRNREQFLQGSCRDCKYINLCGGCRGRALATSGNYLAEAPLCFIRDKNKQATEISSSKSLSYFTMDGKLE